MPDLRQYWQEVHALERSLPEFVWLMSLEDKKRGMVGGRMAQVGAPAAAQLLHSQSHRIATGEEIAAHLERENQVRKQSFHEGLRRKGIAVVEVPVSETPSADSKPATTRRR
jgi:DNA-binding LacI/PurR family transcriptional regulator